MPRASAPKCADDVADVLRAIALQLQSLADFFAGVSEPAAGQSLGSDDEPTPAQKARLEDALARHRRRAKQPQRGRGKP
jgi:hypothetical protein